MIKHFGPYTGYGYSLAKWLRIRSFFAKHSEPPYGTKIPKYMVDFLNDDAGHFCSDGRLNSWSVSPDYWANQVRILSKIDEQGVFHREN